MADIVLSTLNARWAHSALGLRYLRANLGALRERAKILEFEIKADVAAVAEAILAEGPAVVGLGVYIWNVTQMTRLVAELKRRRGEVTVVLGGPEVSYETQEQKICQLADYVVTGEADLAFAELCAKLLAGERPAERVIAAGTPELGRVALPYELYDEKDIAHRVIYVEASRGCPFECDFCLSALDVAVRPFPLEALLGALERLLARGATRFKFVDRTFNVNVRTATAILEFFLAPGSSGSCRVPGLFLHFEVVPDRLPEALKEVIKRFPAGALQFEVGVQTFNEEVAARIHRRQDNAKVEENLRFLRQETGVYVHADLVAGLPGETVESFAAGFDRLLALRPHEIQIELLKRLRGAPIARHDEAWGMRYRVQPPYEIVENSVMDQETLQRLERFARYWDLYFNSRNFAATVGMLWGGAARSPFDAFRALAEWVWEKTGQTHGLALDRQAELLREYLVERIKVEAVAVDRALAADYERCGRRVPKFLREHGGQGGRTPVKAKGLPQRQARSV